MNTIDQLKNSAGVIKKMRPSYTDILDFYTHLFEIREQSKSDMVLEPMTVEQSLLDLKKDSDMPLISPSQFKIDMDSASRLLVKICNLAREYAPHLSADARRMQNAIEDGTLDTTLLFCAVIEDLDPVLNTLSETCGILKKHLVLFGYNSMAPSIEAGAEQLAVYLEKDSKHNHGYCPVCGNPPNLGILDEKGNRILKCCFCNHQWHTKRMGCAFCDNIDPDRQQYFYTNDEKEYRVDLCDNCGNYLKIVDLRQMNRFFYPGIEAVATLHLDMKAKEKGYTGPF